MPSKEGGFIFLTGYLLVGDGSDIQVIMSGRWGSGSIQQPLACLSVGQESASGLSPGSLLLPFLFILDSEPLCGATDIQDESSLLLALSGNAQMFMPRGVSKVMFSLGTLAITP